MDAHANFASSLVVTPPVPPSSGTSLTVTSGQGTRFPAVPFNCTIAPANTLPTPLNAEIVRVTNITGDTFTITRAQEGTSAIAILTGYYIANSITAKVITDVETNVGNPTASLGLTAVNGSASTFMRSDAAPALSQSIAPTWTGQHKFTVGGSIAGVMVVEGTLSTQNSSDPSFSIRRTLTGTGNAHGFADNANFARTSGTDAYNSFDCRISMSGTANFDHLNGFQYLPTYSSSGTLLTAVGFYSAPVFSSGNTTNLYHGIANDATGAGTVNNQYGFYVTALTKGAANNFAFYSAGTTPSRFGKVGVGIDPSQILHVYDTAPVFKLEGNGVTSATIQFTTNSTNRFSIQTPSASADLVFLAGGTSEAARITSAGVFSTLGSNAVNIFESPGVSSIGLQFRTNSANRFKLETPSASADLVAYAGGTTEVFRWSSAGVLVTGTVNINGTAASTTAGQLNLGSGTQSTIGANGAASALTANPLGYLKAFLGTTAIIIPYYNA